MKVLGRITAEPARSSWRKMLNGQAFFQSFLWSLRIIKESEWDIKVLSNLARATFHFPEAPRLSGAQVWSPGVEDSWEGGSDRGESLRGASTCLLEATEKLLGNTTGQNLAGRSTRSFCWLYLRARMDASCLPPFPHQTRLWLQLVHFRLSHILVFSDTNLLILGEEMILVLKDI